MTTIATVENPFRQLLGHGPLVFKRKMSKEDFKDFAVRLEDFQTEREKDGTVIIMPLVKGASGRRETDLIFYLRLWQEKTGSGQVYGSTTGFDLPDGSTKAPDAAWLSETTLRSFNLVEEEEDFIPVAPDFVAEIRSSSDRLAACKRKMTETWMKNGVRLGWLIDPYEEKVYIYRQNEPVEEMAGFTGRALSGEAVMPGMELPLEKMQVRK